MDEYIKRIAFSKGATRAGSPAPASSCSLPSAASAGRLSVVMIPKTEGGTNTLHHALEEELSLFISVLTEFL